MIDVNSGNGSGVVGVIGCRSTVDAGVVANVRAVPIGGELVGVGSHGMFPCSEGYVGLLESWVWHQWEIRRIDELLEGELREEQKEGGNGTRKG